MSNRLHDPLGLTVDEALYAASIGQMVALGHFTMKQGDDLIHLWPGRPGTTIKIDPRRPLRPTYWLKDSTGWPFLHGLHTRMSNAMRDSANATGRDLARQQIETERQETRARKAAGPLLARGAQRNRVIAEINATCPGLRDEHVAQIADQEAAWWLRWRHDHGCGATIGNDDDDDYEGAA